MKTAMERLKKLQRQYENRFFYIGVICGLVAGIILGTFIYEINSISTDYSSIKIEKDNELLYYIDGEWVSAVNDVKLKIKIDPPAELFLIEVLNNTKKYKHFQIISKDDINGILGIVKLTLCESSCEDSNNHITIQINKIFGKRDIIVLTYTNKLTDCLSINDECVRAFSRLN